VHAKVALASQLRSVLERFCPGPIAPDCGAVNTCGRGCRIAALLRCASVEERDDPGLRPRGSSVPTAKPKGSIFGPLAVPALAVGWDPAAVYYPRETPERTSMSQRPQLKLGTSDPRCPPVGAATTGSRSGLAVEDLLERMNEREKEDRG
jgi:hypothetical protein